MPKIFFRICLLVLGVLLLGAGCSSTDKAVNAPAGVVESPVAESNKVMINHFVFEPKEIAVSVGTTVVWSHNDNVAHTIVSPGLFESQVMKRGDEFSFTFDKSGEYAYYCGLHPSMTGKIIVK